MSDLIERGDARSDIICLRTYQHRCRDEWLTLVSKRDVINAINSIPSADRPRGEWIPNSPFTGNCSECGADGNLKDNYCSNCGARMFAKDINVPNKKGADDE